MARTRVLGAVSLVCAVSSVMGGVRIVYDRDAEFEGFETFALRFASERGQETLENRSPLMHQQIVESLTRHLAEGGLREVEDDPDLIVTYHVTTKGDGRINTALMGFGGAGPGFGGGGWTYGDTPTYATSFGLLIIDVYDANEQKIIWRGRGAQVPSGNPAKGAKTIERSIDKLVSKWDKMRRQHRPDRSTAPC